MFRAVANKVGLDEKFGWAEGNIQGIVGDYSIVDIVIFFGVDTILYIHYIIFMQIGKQPTLTAKQQQVYRLIEEYIEKHGVSPTVTELGTFLQVNSLRTITQILEALERKQLISRSRYQSRGIKLVDEDSETVAVPVVSAAGCDNLSIFAQETFGEYITLAKDFLQGKKREQAVVIKAVGDSMTDAGIEDGDYVLTELTQDVINGDKVVAIVNSMAVIKKYAKTKNAVVLSPMSDNPEYSQIIMTEDFDQIIGKVIDIIKNPKNEEIVYIPV